MNNDNLMYALLKQQEYVPFALDLIEVFGLMRYINGVMLTLNHNLEDDGEIKSIAEIDLKSALSGITEKLSETLIELCDSYEHETIHAVVRQYSTKFAAILGLSDEPPTLYMLLAQMALNDGFTFDPVDNNTLVDRLLANLSRPEERAKIIEHIKHIQDDSLGDLDDHPF